VGVFYVSKSKVIDLLYYNISQVIALLIHFVNIHINAIYN